MIFDILIHIFIYVYIQIFLPQPIITLMYSFQFIFKLQYLDFIPNAVVLI